MSFFLKKIETRFKNQEPRLKMNRMVRHNFKKLKIWQESMSLARETYKMVPNFPDY